MSAEIKNRECFDHLKVAASELRQALSAALDDDKSPHLVRNLASALADVSDLIPWSFDRPALSEALDGEAPK